MSFPWTNYKKKKWSQLGDVKYEVRSNARSKVNILIEDRNCMYASVLF